MRFLHPEWFHGTTIDSDSSLLTPEGSFRLSADRHEASLFH